MSLKRKIDRRRLLAEAKQTARQRERLGDTTIRVISLLKASPLESRQAFAVDLFKRDPLADRINTAWMIVRGKVSGVRGEAPGVDEHEDEAV